MKLREEKLSIERQSNDIHGEKVKIEQEKSWLASQKEDFVRIQGPRVLILQFNTSKANP